MGLAFQSFLCHYFPNNTKMGSWGSWSKLIIGICVAAEWAPRKPTGWFESVCALCTIYFATLPIAPMGCIPELVYVFPNKKSSNQSIRVKLHVGMAITIAHKSSRGQWEIYPKPTKPFSHGTASICPCVYFQTLQLKIFTLTS